MSTPPVTLRDPDGLDYIESVLSANDLPTRDIHGKEGSLFVATADGERVGVGGIEQYGTEGLLRSVVVERTYRREGYGTALCTKLEANAHRDGIQTLYALTTTAAGFFGDRSYEGINRNAVPERLQRTAEFSELCPTTATCLRKRLDQ